MIGFTEDVLETVSFGYDATTFKIHAYDGSNWVDGRDGVSARAD